MKNVQISLLTTREILMSWRIKCFQFQVSFILDKQMFDHNLSKNDVRLETAVNLIEQTFASQLPVVSCSHR